MQGKHLWNINEITIIITEEIFKVINPSLKYVQHNVKIYDCQLFNSIYHTCFMCTLLEYQQFYEGYIGQNPLPRNQLNDGSKRHLENRSDMNIVIGWSSQSEIN